MASSNSLFNVYLIERTLRQDKTGEFLEVSFRRIRDDLIIAASPDEALKLAQEYYPTFPHRLAIGEAEAHERYTPR